MRNLELKNIDSDDLIDFLLEVEHSFDIKFVEAELINIKRFGELSDAIINKIALRDFESCTSQQAFYKLRQSLSKNLELDRNTISSGTLLAKLFPKFNRRKNVEKVEK